MPPQAWGALAAFTLFALSATFYAGVLSARMSAIEKWRDELRGELRADIDRLMRAVHKIEVRLGVADED